MQQPSYYELCKMDGAVVPTTDGSRISQRALIRRSPPIYRDPAPLAERAAIRTRVTRRSQ